MASFPGFRPWRQHLRFRLGTLMAVVALAAFLTWGYVMKVRWDDYRRAYQRVEWSRRMFKKGYVSRAILQSEELDLLRARRRLGM